MWASRYIALVALIASGQARANPIEVFGLTSRRAGQANTGVAAADDASALYYDPAGLVAAPGRELVVGVVGAYSHLTINGSRARLSDPVGLQLGTRSYVPLGGENANRIAVGLVAHLVPRYAGHVIAPGPGHAFYLHYGDRLSRFVVLPGAAVRVTNALALGIAVDGLAGTSYAPEGVDADAPIVARVIAGARYRVSPTLVLGAVYRQRFDIPFAATRQVIVDGEPVDVELRGSGLFTPHQLAAGVAYTTTDLLASLDLGYAMWSRYRGPYVRQSPAIDAVPVVPFRDTFSVRAGLESTGDGLVFRGGYGLESGAVPRVQTGVTNLLDGAKHTVAFGAGYGWGRMRVDAHVQVQLVATRRTSKSAYDGTGDYDPFTSLADEDAEMAGFQTSNLGYPTMKSGGEVAIAGITFAARL